MTASISAILIPALRGLFLLSSLFAATAASQAQTLELKFWPQDKIYLYAVAEPWLHDVVLQNVAIVNRTGKTVTLEQMRISVVREGRVTQERLLWFSSLEPGFKSFYAKYKAGDLKVWDAEYHLTDFFANATLADSPRLGPNEGVTVRDQYFAFNDQVDTLQVTVLAKAEDGSAIEASAGLPLDSYESKTTLRLPLTGTWQVANGPFPQVSHRWVIHQEFGYDFWKVDTEGSDHKGDGTHYEDYYSYGRPVVAPADATVVDLRSDADDAPLLNDALIKDQADFIKKIQAYRDLLFQKGGYRELGGNYLALDHGNGEFSLLVHLKKGSVRVKKGDKVKAGELLAQVGNSGLSNVPHLHYELGDAPNLPGRRGLPLRISGLSDDPKPRLLHFEEFVRNGNN